MKKIEDVFTKTTIKFSKTRNIELVAEYNWKEEAENGEEIVVIYTAQQEQDENGNDYECLPEAEYILRDDDIFENNWNDSLYPMIIDGQKEFRDFLLTLI